MKRLVFSLILIVSAFVIGISIGVNAGSLAQKLSGRILLQVQQKGEAWYINPADLKRYYLGGPADAFVILRQLGLGISNADLNTIPIARNSKVSIAAEGRQGTPKQESQQPNIQFSIPVIQDPELVFTHISDLENNEVLREGDTKVLLAFKITANQLIKLNSIRLVNSRPGSLSNITDLGLYDSAGILLAKFNQELVASGLNKILEGKEGFMVMGYVASSVRENYAPKLGIISNSQINITPLARITGLPIESK